MARPEARTLAEAFVYLELTLPPGDEPLDLRRRTTLHTEDDRYVLAFDGPYQDEPVTAEVAVPVAAQRAAEADDAAPGFGPGLSTLIDAGQWAGVELYHRDAVTTALDRLADEPLGRDEYWDLMEALGQAHRCVTEVLKFLPDDADAVPADAFWTEDGRRLAELNPELFARRRLEDARAEYAETRERFRRYAHRPEYERATDPAEPVDDGPELPARTTTEAFHYMDLRPCPDCGSPLFDREPDVEFPEDGLVVTYRGPCRECGRPRAFRFRLPDRPAAERERHADLPGWPGDGPSQLLDPGEWWLLSGSYAALADAMFRKAPDAAEWRDEGNRTAMVRVLTTAAAAVDEVLRFFPAGADALPPTVFWTDNGREVYRSEGRRFRRDRMTELRDLRWQALAEFTARYPEAVGR